MKYMLLFYWNTNAPQNPSPEEYQAIAREWGKFTHDANEAGALITTNGLAPASTATTLRIREGKRVISDGPFAETHEQLGGFALMECKDLDEALTWAEMLPPSRDGSIEIRPLWDQQAAS